MADCRDKLGTYYCNILLKKIAFMQGTCMIYLYRVLLIPAHLKTANALGDGGITTGKHDYSGALQGMTTSRHDGKQNSQSQEEGSFD